MSAMAAGALLMGAKVVTGPEHKEADTWALGGIGEVEGPSLWLEAGSGQCVPWSHPPEPSTPAHTWEQQSFSLEGAIPFPHARPIVNPRAPFVTHVREAIGTELGPSNSSPSTVLACHPA